MHKHNINSIYKKNISTMSQLILNKKKRFKPSHFKVHNGKKFDF